MDARQPPQVLSAAQIAEMRAIFECWRFEAAAAMYRTDDFERPYRAGRGEMYRLWNLMGQAIELLDLFEREQYPDHR